MNSRKPAYSSWRAMLARCGDQRSPSYSRYGGRGITVCDRWKAFDSFLADMGERPDGMTLDRLDSNGNYEPGNCRWATLSQQARNTRNAVLLNGRHISDISDATGTKYSTLYKRAHRKPISTDPRPTNKIGVRGVTQHGKRWRATITVAGKQRRLGIFDTPEEAGAAYRAEAERIKQARVAA